MFVEANLMVLFHSFVQIVGMISYGFSFSFDHELPGAIDFVLLGG